MASGWNVGTWLCLDVADPRICNSITGCHHPTETWDSITEERKLRIWEQSAESPTILLISYFINSQNLIKIIQLQYQQQWALRGLRNTLTW